MGSCASSPNKIGASAASQPPPASAASQPALSAGAAPAPVPRPARAASEVSERELKALLEHTRSAMWEERLQAFSRLEELTRWTVTMSKARTSEHDAAVYRVQAAWRDALAAHGGIERAGSCAVEELDWLRGSQREGAAAAGRRPLVTALVGLLASLARGPSGNFKFAARQRAVGSTGAFEAMHAALRAGRLSAGERLQVLNLVWSLANIDEGRARIREDGVQRTLVSILRSKEEPVPDRGTLTVAAGALYCLALDEAGLEAVEEAGGFDTIIGLCQHLDSSVHFRALVGLQIFAQSPRYRTKLCALRAHEWLIPLLVAADDVPRLAACTIGTLCLDDEALPIILASGVLREVLHFARRYTVPYNAPLVAWQHKDIDIFVEMSRRRDVPAVRLVGAVALAFAAATATGGPAVASVDGDDHSNVQAHNRELMTAPGVVLALRDLADASDPFCYHLAARALDLLGLPAPYFREAAPEDGPPRPLPLWTVDDVSRWVAQQPFARYEGLFRAAWVDGRVLPRLTDPLLADMGIASGVHRLVVADAIEALAGRVRPFEEDAGGGLSAAPSPAPAPAAPEPGVLYDVFISYRRQGGSQLGALLKIFLQLRGLRVFMDVDDLGQGAFDDALLQSLGRSRALLAVLSPGALDRAIHDPNNEDWVRREIAFALRRGLNVVPVMYGFTFPKATELPADIRDIVRHNAVEWSDAYKDASVDKVVGFLRAPPRRPSGTGLPPPHPAVQSGA